MLLKMLQKYNIPCFNNWKQNEMLHQHIIWKQKLLLYSKIEEISSELIINGSCTLLNTLFRVFNKRKNYLINMPETAQISRYILIFDSWESDPYII